MKDNNVFKRFKRSVKERFHSAMCKRNFTRKIVERYDFRTIVFAVISTIINFGFVAFNVTFAVITHSVWYSVLSGYYGLLTILRAGVIFFEGKAKKHAGGDDARYLERQLRNYRFCGYAICVLNFAIAAAVTLMVSQQKPVKYSSIMAIGVAAYTVYKITLAAVNVAKARRLKNPLIQTLRNIGAADAAVSLLSLQTALIATFSEDGDTSLMPLNAVTGFAVCAFTICLGIFMIVKATRELNKLKNQ